MYIQKKHEQKKRYWHIYCKDEYIEEWPYLLAEKLKGIASVFFVRDISIYIEPIYDSQQNHNPQFPEDGTIHIRIEYDEGYLILASGSDLLNRWSILIGHFYETTNMEQHIMIEEMIKDFMSNIEDKDAEKKSQREKTWRAWLRCFLPW
ncbi:MAG: hypothetical protein LBI18_08065 [Planctomycetaceae bacterium]|jgi:hypothetical protein|nr:hypothetical protein [Planctomycetaceae bacterium]